MLTDTKRDDAGCSMKPEAAIVNYYNLERKSLPMGPHQDDLELTMKAPVVSISVGCTAVFLVGTHTMGYIIGAPALTLCRLGCLCS